MFFHPIVIAQPEWIGRRVLYCTMHACATEFSFVFPRLLYYGTCRRVLSVHHEVPADFSSILREFLSSTQHYQERLFVKCRFTVNLIKEWLGLHAIDTPTWVAEHSLKRRWSNVPSDNIPNRSAMASLIMLVGWTIRNESNTRVFRHKSTPPPIIFNGIKREVRLWVIAGAIFFLSYHTGRVMVSCNKGCV